MFRIFGTLALVALLFTPCFAGEDKKPTEADKAKATIERDRQERKEAAAKELEAILKKYRMKLSVGMLVTDQGNIPQLNLVPVD
ncbi:MAG: hypothetical protein ACYDHZ_00480 [Dehalococcoidia bacterium]